MYLDTLVNKIILSIKEHINKCMDVINKSEDNLKILSFSFDMLNNTKTLSIQSNLKYTYYFANIFLEIISYIKKSEGELNKDDIKVISQCIDILGFVFTEEIDGYMDVLKYNNICKNIFNLIEQSDIKILSKDKLNTSNKHYLLRDVFTKYKSNLNNKINVDIQYSDIHIGHKYILEIENIIYCLDKYISNHLAIENKSCISIKSYIYKSLLYVIVDIDNLIIDFEHIVKRMIELNLLSKSDILGKNNSELFDTLVSEKYFDLSELFLPFKEIKMNLDLLLANITYEEDKNIKRFCMSIPCNFSMNLSMIHIDDNKYLIGNMYIDEIILCKEASFEDEYLVVNNENIHIIQNDIFNITDLNDNMYIVILLVEDMKFAFYCNKIYKYDNSLVNTLSHTLSKSTHIQNILGLSTDKYHTLVLDLIDMKNRLLGGINESSH
jgi:hypothetical protein